MFHAGNNLKTHFESHTGESAVKCRCCAKVFSCWRLTWSVHTEERLSACELCAKAFSSGNNLKIHMKAQAGGRPYQCRHWRCCEKYFTKTTALKTQELFHSGEKYKGGEKPMCIYVSSETSTQALWVCFRWKPLFLAPFCHTLEHCVTLRSKGTNHWQKHFLCEICGKVSTPASNLRKHIWSSMWGKNIKLDPTCINCGFSVIKTAELKSHEMLHTGKSQIPYFWKIFPYSQPHTS